MHRPCFLERGKRLMLVAVTAVALAAGAETKQVHEDFADDPQWQGHNQFPDVPRCVTVEQRFGFSDSGFAGGGRGEIGGRVCRSMRPARYYTPIPPLSFEDEIHFSGKFTVTASSGGSGILFGLFNKQSRGWRTPNSLVIRFDGEGRAYRPFFEYGTQHFKTGGGQTWEGQYQTHPESLHPADGLPHTFSLAYDPKGAEGLGLLRFTLDGAVYTEPLPPGHKADGLTLDCLGIMNVQLSGEYMSLFLDDLELNGTRYAFDSDPQWVSEGSWDTFEDCLHRPQHDVRHRATQLAGGAPGELGGIIWRIESTTPEHAMHYGAPTGRLTLDQPLRARGRIVMVGAAADSAVLLGWYNPLTFIGAPPQNFIGALIEGPSRAGHYVRPAACSSNDIKEIAQEGPLIYADAQPHTWSIEFAPAAEGAPARITTTLDEVPATLELSAEFMKGNAMLARFGILSWHTGGNFVEIYLDDIEYTSGQD